MTTDSQAPGGTGKFILKVVGGAIFGAGSTGLFLYVFGGDGLELGDPAVMLAAAAGLSYFLIGLLVGFGALAPGAGAHILDVEDADELREERPKLAPSAVACMLIGVFLIALALAPGAAGTEGRFLVLLVAGACLAGALLIGFFAGSGDELVRQIGLEASSATLHIGLFILAMWGALAHLGYAGWVDPLGLLGGAALLYLLAIFAIAGKRGLMRPR